MTRRKSVCFKWTLVLVLVIFSPYVNSRPQETSQPSVSSSSKNSLEISKPTENPIRYRYRYNNISSNAHKPPVDLHIVYKPDLVSNNFTDNSIKVVKNLSASLSESNNVKTNHSNLVAHRLSRVIRHRYKNKVQSDPNNKNNNHNKNSTNRPFKDSKEISNATSKKRPYSNANNALVQKDAVEPVKAKYKPLIKKVVTKWTDNAKFEDLDFTSETTTSEENGQNIVGFANSLSSGKYGADNNSPESENQSDKRFPDKRYRPRPQYPEETQIYSNNVQILDNYPFPSTRPPYIFNTPTPTPIITNVGYPQPWPQYQQQPIYQTMHTRPTTSKPIKMTKPVKNTYNHHNTYQNNYPQYPNFEVTTFQPTTAYTDRIVIRPEEYSASPDDCPTIFLTLNNTFQGQGKEVCPDLNIAVNTNVINKNVVVESDEDGDTALTDVFDIPLAGDSESDETPQDYFDSVENQEETESASIEATGLTNYNAANVVESSESNSFGSPSASLSASNRPGRPSDDDDDSFGLSSIISFFKPALNAFGWLASINPLSFGLLSILLAPLVLLVAGTSGIAALVAPWALSYGRKAPKIVHVYRPQWQWDDEYKAWQLNSFPDREWHPSSTRSPILYVNPKRRSIEPTWFFKTKELIQAAADMLKVIGNRVSIQDKRKSKRKKRETWTIRVK